MKNPRFAEANFGAVAGAVVGAIGGLVAVAIPWAVVSGDIKALAEGRSYGLIGFMVSVPCGWFFGGQIGPRLEVLLSERNAGLVGGLLGGAVPVAGLALWGWHLIRS